MGLLFAAPSLAGVGLLILVPFADVIRRSFFESIGGGFVGLRNYAAVLQSDAFRLAAANTLKFVAICIPLLVLLSLLLAVLVYSLKRGQDLLKAGFLLPMAVPAASVVLIWKLFFHENGLLNGLVLSLGGTPVDYMHTQAAFWVLIVSYLWRNLGYDMILWMAGLSGIPAALYEAASLDGAGRATMFFRITLPNLTTVLFTIFVLSLLNSFKVFREAYLVAGEYPHTSMYLLQHLFNNWFLSLDVDKLCAGAVLTAAVIFVLILLLHKAWGETYE